MAGKFLNSLQFLLFFIFALILGSGVSFGKSQNDPSTVTIPLDDYLNLIKEDKKELQFSTVESVDLAGTYGKDLSITFHGSSSSNPLQVPVMEYNNKFSISSCKGSAALSLEKTEVVLFPRTERFKVSCALKVNDWANLQFNFKKILSVNLEVRGAEAIYQPGSVGEKVFSIFPKDRQLASTNESPSLVSRYHLSLLKDENRFKYFFRVENPNKKAQDFVFTPRESEVVKGVHSSLRYEEKEGSYHFVLPPGSSHFRVEGRFNGEKWTAPLPSGLSYLLIDQHPMITSKINTDAKRVSKGRVGISGRFPVARAYILSNKDKFYWEKSELEAFSASTYTIDQANYDYYWAKSGHDLVEVTYTINNQGANEIPLKLPGAPTYLAINHQAQVLTKTKNDELLLNVPTGENQQVTIQYKVDKSQPRFLASIHSDLPKPETSVSASHLALQLPKSYQPLFFQNGDDWEFFLGFPRIFQSLLLFMFLFFFLNRVQMDHKIIISIAGGFSLLSLYFHSVFSWAVFLVVLAFFLAYRDRINLKENFTPKKMIAGFAIICFVMIAWVGTQVTFQRFADVSRGANSAELQALATNTQGFGGRAGMVPKKGSLNDAPKGMSFAKEKVAATLAMDQTEVQQDNYQGLPAKIQIPSEGRRIYLKQGFTDAKRDLAFVAWSFNSWILKGFNFCLLFLCLFLVWRERNKLLIYTKIKWPLAN